MLHILNYIVTLLLQIWLFLKLLCGLNCSTLYRVPFLDPTYYFWRMYTPYSTTHSISQCIYIITTKFPLLQFLQLAHHYTSRLRRTNKKVTLHSTAIDWMYAVTARSAFAVSSRCSRVHFHFLTAVLLASDAAVAAELQYSPHLSRHLHSLHGAVMWLCTLCSMFISVGLLSLSLSLSLSVPIIIHHARLAASLRKANYNKSAKLLKYTQQLLWLSEVSGHACGCSDVLLSQRLLL